MPEHLKNSPAWNPANFRWKIRQYASSRPAIWRLACRLRGATFNMMDRDCVLACEGYPRSANSFAEAALLLTQGDIKIAHHRHVPAQLVIALNLGKPALLLIRKPEDAIASMLLRDGGSTNMEREVLTWLDFHEPILSEKRNLVISDFPVTTRAFNSVVSELARRYPTMISASELSNEELSSQAFALIPEISRKRNATAKLNYGTALSTQDRETRAGMLKDLKKDLLAHYPKELRAAELLYQEFRSTSVKSEY